MRTSDAEKVLVQAYVKLYDVVGFFPDSYIAGGAIASLILGEQINDYDMWFRTAEAWDKATAAVKKVASETNELNLENEGKLNIVAETPFALSFRLTGDPILYQMIKTRLGDPETTVETFDFQHAQAYFLGPTTEAEYKDDPIGEIVFLGYNSEDFIQEKVLLFVGELDYPTHTLSRVPKFAKRGFVVPDQMLVRLIHAIRAADEKLIKLDANRIGLRYNKGLRYDMDDAEDNREISSQEPSL